MRSTGSSPYVGAGARLKAPEAWSGWLQPQLRKRACRKNTLATPVQDGRRVRDLACYRVCGMDGD